MLKPHFIFKTFTLLFEMMCVVSPQLSFIFRLVRKFNRLPKSRIVMSQTNSSKKLGITLDGVKEDRLAHKRRYSGSSCDEIECCKKLATPELVQKFDFVKAFEDVGTTIARNEEVLSVPKTTSSKKAVNEENKRRNKYKKKKEKTTSKGEDEESSPLSTVPNYFFAVQITDSEVQNKLIQVQEDMLIAEITTEAIKKVATTGKIYKDALISPTKFHFTLHVFHAANADDLAKAKNVLHKVGTEIKEGRSSIPPSLHVKGLGHFKNTVIFAKLEKEEDQNFLHEMAAKLKNEAISLNLVGDTKPFKPHMTIAKMSKASKLKRKKIRTFPSEIWKKHENASFGSQKVKCLQLLSMQYTDPNTKYYKIIDEFYFSHE